MKKRALVIFVLSLTIALFAVAPATNFLPAFSTTAQSDSAKPANYSDTAKEDLPMTDRIPWLIYVVLASAVVALAWILFSLAREQRRNPRRTDQQQT